MNGSERINNCNKLLYNWVYMKQLGMNISDYLEIMGIHKVAVYGAGKYGVLLYNELLNSTVEIVYGIDRGAGNINFIPEVYKIGDSLEHVDIVIITPFWEAKAIIPMLKEKKMKFIMLDDLVYSTIAIGELGNE